MGEWLAVCEKVGVYIHRCRVCKCTILPINRSHYSMCHDVCKLTQVAGRQRRSLLIELVTIIRQLVGVLCINVTNNDAFFVRSFLHNIWPSMHRMIPVSIPRIKSKKVIRINKPTYIHCLIVECDPLICRSHASITGVFVTQLESS